MDVTGAEHPFEDRTATLERQAQPPLAVVVRVLEGQATPTAFRLENGSCVLGSAAGCDIVVVDRAVSRRHLELSLAPEGVRVVDLGSRNGTYFHGQRIERMGLRFGAELTMGSTRLAVEADADALARDAADDVDETPSYRGIVGTSEPMRRVFAMLRRLEGSLATILVEGESGVGKERVARALHEGSRVAEGPMVTLNCGAFPRELIASELFGHRRGAFSGAVDDRKGAFQSADGGTLFLDEIGELPLELQPMLLRAIELGEVKRLGDERTQQVDVRLVAATNRDLEAEVAEGRFRHDLFYRLAVVRLSVPPLRQRPDDVAPLAQYFAHQQGLDPLDAATMTELQRRSWPGNARELKNALVSFQALGVLPDAASSGVPTVATQVSSLVDLDRPFVELKDEIVDSFSRLYLERLMEETSGNQSEAARRSGMNRTYLVRLLDKYGVDKGRR